MVTVYIWLFSLRRLFSSAAECRKVFSSSSEFVLPLLKQVVADVFGKADKLRNVSPT